MAAAAGVDFLVDRKDFHRTRFVDVAVPEIGAGQVLFRVDRFALTANNVSYALVGDALGYWRFFPCPPGEDDWGRIPVIGFGDVLRSLHPGVREGTRCFGFYPMSRHLVIEPASATPGQIVDGAAHRAGLAPAYSQYSPVQHDALYHPDHEDVLMLLRGLFLTSFLAEDFLAEHDHYGAESIVVSSASSKTGIALAHRVSQARDPRPRAVGLTSSGHLDFVRGLGCYDRVLPYEEIASLDADAPAVFVDLAGSGAIQRAVHEHFGPRLRYSCSIGATHWQAERTDAALPGPKPEFFFAPGQIQKRVRDWGAAGLQQRLAEAWSGFRSFTEGWLEIERGTGRAAVERVYRDTLLGRTRPERGHVLSLWDGDPDLHPVTAMERE